MKNIEIAPIQTWLPHEKPLLIAGPCSAETELQVIQTAKQIAQRFPNAIFRAGIWKPRTRPNAFEGIGEEALKWMQLVKEETGMKVSTEIANAEHAELCLKYGIDILWIGARTTVNPFSVQEIADSLKGVDIPVFVKNPVHPDLQLWLGAIERIAGAGITKLAAIHRGFHSYEPSSFRNKPKWNIAIELKRLLPDLPIICDPSHICGNTELLPFVAQKAMDLAMDGLMLETHITPQQAWSDAKQQVTPDQLQTIMANLTTKAVVSDSQEFTDKLAELRENINQIDNDLLQLLKERMETVRQIGTYKKENGVTVLQLVRWDEVLNSRVNVGEQLGMSKDFVTKLYGLIHSESVKVQSAILAS